MFSITKYIDGVKHYLTAGFQLVADEQLARNANDATAQVLKVKAGNPDVTMFVLYPAESAVFLRDAEKYGLKGPFIGTNSVHMIIVRVRPDLSFEIIDREKDMVRLGAGGLDGRQLTTEAMNGALQALSAVLGGTQSLHTNSFDEALALPTESSVELALRTQQIIGYETGVADVIDPLAGSYYIETLTDRVEAEALAYLQRIEDMGGALTCIEQGFQQREIQESAFRLQRMAETKERIVVGVNQFQTEALEVPPILRVDPAIGQRQIARLKALRARRDQAAVDAALAAIRTAAQGTENMVPLLIAAVESYATIGEICNVLRDEWGEYQEVLTI